MIAEASRGFTRTREASCPEMVTVPIDQLERLSLSLLFSSENKHVPCLAGSSLADAAR